MKSLATMALESERDDLLLQLSDAMRERDDYKHAFECEKTKNEEALEADRKIERALGRAEQWEYAEGCAASIKAARQFITEAFICFKSFPRGCDGHGIGLLERADAALAESASVFADGGVGSPAYDGPSQAGSGGQSPASVPNPNSLLPDDKDENGTTFAVARALLSQPRRIPVEAWDPDSESYERVTGLLYDPEGEWVRIQTDSDDEEVETEPLAIGNHEGWAGSGNYTANDELLPTKVVFANGRTVELRGNGYLVVGMDQRQGADSPYGQAFASGDPLNAHQPNKAGTTDARDNAPELTPIAQSAPATIPEGWKLHRDTLDTAWRWASYVFDNRVNLGPKDQKSYEALRDAVFKTAIAVAPEPPASVPNPRGPEPEWMHADMCNTVIDGPCNCYVTARRAAWLRGEWPPKPEQTAIRDHEPKGTFACPHCGRDTPHTHSHEELEAYAEIKRYPNLLCEPFGGSDYCYHCGRDMCVGKLGFNTVCPARKRSVLSQRGQP